MKISNLKKIAIIPARGGSKRIPRKNIKSFLGKPIIAYTIKCAIDSNLFDEVMVSTDDTEIAEIAKAYGAKIPFLRTAQNADDFATTFDVIKEVIDVYSSKNQKFDLACCIYPCSPLLKIESLKSAEHLLTKNNFDCTFPVVPFSFPIQRAFKLNDKSKVEFLQKENALVRTQDLETYYHDAGQFYYFNIQKVFKANQLITDNSASIILNELEVQDIDNLTDWKIAELKYKLQNE